MSSKSDPSKIAFVASSIGLVFLAGFLVGVLRLPPYGALKFGLDAVLEVGQNRETLVFQRPESFLEPARHDGDGVTVLDPNRMAPGLTLLSGFFGESNEVRLVDAGGEPVARWPVDVTEIFPDLDHIEPPGHRPTDGWGTDIHGALALSDGSVLFNFEYMGLVKLDRCGEVVWTLPRMTHHSIHPSVDGNFWVPDRVFVLDNSELPPLTTPYHEDLILKVSPEGRVLQEISVPGLMLRNGLQSLLTANSHFDVSERPRLEIVHVNDIEELTPELAPAFPDFEAGDLVLSLRHLNLLMVVDPDAETVRWHRTGPWIRQHDPDFRPDGTITVFDNNADGALGALFGGSRIVSVTPSATAPSTGPVDVLYGGTEEQAMYTDIRGKSQTLPNGNLLVTEALAGRVFEVTPDGELVWEFINRYDDDEVARLSDAVRYPPDHFRVETWTCAP